MISVDEARSLVLRECVPLLPVDVATVDSLGLILAADIASDIDSPPDDKALMDGYAVVATDLTGGSAELVVLEEITAGAVPSETVVPGMTTRIMTGAPMPAGADAVVMIERTKLVDSDRVRVDDQVVLGQNIMRRAASMRNGEIILKAGTRLRAIEIGLLSEVGRVEVPVMPRPRVAVLPTGNELVAATEIPSAGQIRNSNGPMLRAMVETAGGIAVNLGIGRDEPVELKELITRGLEQDVLVLSGGVSAGVADLVPGIMDELGVRRVFHKVDLKPGKPVWFGAIETEGRVRLVFGLPGNPVSSLVCFELFVRPAIARLGGHDWREPQPILAKLTKEFHQRGGRPTYYPAELHDDGSVRLLNWKGSADLRTLSDANCLVFFPPGETTYSPSADVEVRLRL